MTATLELTHTYESRGAARLLLAERASEVLLSGPAGTGKSRACLEKLNLAALKYPGMRGLMVRQVRDTLASTGMTTFEEFTAKELIDAGAIKFRGATSRKPARYAYHNGSELWTAGMDKPSKIMSAEFDMVFIQEATELRLEGWEALTTRLRRTSMPYRQIIADCNPDKPTHWLKQRAQTGATKLLESRHTDNPNYYDADGNVTPGGVEYMAILDRLTGVRKLRLRDGLWVAAEGVIFESYDPATHVVPRFDVPDEWMRIWSVDFGTVHPFVLQCWAIDPDGRMFMYREMYHTGRMVAIVAPGGVWKEPKPARIICDHQAQERASLRKYLGLSNSPADKRVKLGIEAAEARFASKRIFFMENSLVERDPKLKEARKPTSTVEEFGGYVWDANKEAPVKEDDDGSDAVRYAVANQDLKRRIVSDREVWV